MTVLDDCQKAARSTYDVPEGQTRALSLAFQEVAQKGGDASLEAFLSHPGTEEQLAKLLQIRFGRSGATRQDVIDESRSLVWVDIAGALLDELRKELVDACAK